MSHTVFLSLGSNLGDRQKNLTDAIAELKKHGAIAAVSSYYETEPQNLTDQPWFINCVIQLEINLSPHELLQKIKIIELQLGRVRTEKYGPRSIDIDIILYDTMTLNEPRLTIPHPRLHKRAFVLIPLLEITPTATHPLFKKSLSYYLDQAKNQIVSKL